MKPKYKLIPVETVHGKMYRIKALRPIPERNIRRWKKGGLVSGPEVLSHEGTCWIDYDAIVIDGTVNENAVVSGNAQVIKSHLSGDSTVTDDAQVGPHVLVKDNVRIAGSSQITGTAEDPSTIVGNVTTFGHCMVASSHLADKTKIDDNAKVFKSQLGGNTSVSNSVQISNSTVSNSKLQESAKVIDSIVASSELSSIVKVEKSSLTNSKLFYEAKAYDSFLDHVTVEHHAGIYNSKLLNSRISGVEEIRDRTEEDLIVGMEGWRIFLEESRQRVGYPREIPGKRKIPAIAAPKISAVNSHLKALQSIEEKYEAYTTDIVNLITFPVMTDTTDKYTLELVKALSKARRYADDGDNTMLASVVDELEDAFLMAESNARKIRDTHLNTVNQKKLQTAQQMFALALSDTSDHEKATSFKAGMSTLRGVIDVPEKAVIALKGRIGLKELTA